METHVRDVSIKLQKRVINLHIIPYFMGRCVIWIDITIFLKFIDYNYLPLHYILYGKYWELSAINDLLPMNILLDINYLPPILYSHKTL